MASGFRVASAYVEIDAKTDKAEAEVDKLPGKIKGKLGAGAATAGAVAGGLLAKGFSDNMSIEVGRGKLQAQLGLSQADADKAGKAAGGAYRNNWGGSLEEVNGAIRAVGQNLGDVSKMSQSELQGMAEKALALSSTFDVDVNQAAEAAGKMITNGMAKNATEAFDILTSGFQGGADRSGDFLETLNEYAPQFKKLGLDGAEATALLSAGLRAGARDTDVIADSFKEFSIRAIDGSKTTAAGFQAAGLDAKKMGDEIAAGGPRAQVAMQQTLQGLLSIEDPVARNKAGVELFGTTWEDTVQQILPALANVSLETESTAGATQRMMDTVGDNAQAKIDGAKRSFEGWTQSMASSTGVMGLVSTGVLTFGGSAVAAGGDIGMLVSGLKAMNLGAALGVVKTGALAVAQGVASAATGIWTGAQWLLNAAMTANPIGIIIVLIAALVAAIIIAWKNSETFRTVVIAVWNAIKAAISAVVEWFTTNIPKVWEAAQKVWDAVKVGATTAWNAVKAIVNLVIQGITVYIQTYLAVVTAIFNAVKSVILGVWNAIKSAATVAWNGITAVVKSAVSTYVSAVTGLRDKIVSVFSNAGSWLRDAGRRIIQGLIDGISNAVGALKSKLSQVTNLIPSWKGPPGKDEQLLRPAGGLIMKGLQQGIDSELPSLRANLGDVTATIASTPVAAPAARGSVNLEVHFHGTYDMASDADRQKAARQIRDELVKLEGAYR